MKIKDYVKHLLELDQETELRLTLTKNHRP